MHHIIEFEEIGSTNDYLKDNYLDLNDGDVVITNHQTSGKGRKGRTWQDDSSSLLVSWLLKDSLNADSISLIPLLVGTSVHLTLRDLGIRSEVKWPNDVLIEGKKCAGILVEGVTSSKVEALIIGVGLNVNNKSFDPSIQNKATSLSLTLKKDLDKKRILSLMLKNFDSLYKDYRNGDNSFIRILRKCSYLDGKKAYLDYYDEKKYVTVIAIQDDGRLLVKDDKSEFLLNAGEVSLDSVYSK